MGRHQLNTALLQTDDKKLLEKYIDQLKATNISTLNKNEQLAFWINLYNALTIKIILDHYPVKSIRDINISGIFSTGPWGAKVVTVMNQELSLDDIEHKIIRPLWKDPRTHYALNCASVSCPNLHDHAYEGDSIDAVLNEAAIQYINNPRGIRIDDKKIIVSEIYKWYEDDFPPSLIDYLKSYANPKLKSLLTKIDDYSYDWSLNGY